MDSNTATTHNHPHGHHHEDDGVFIVQHWNEYTPEQHSVWQKLYQRRMQHLEQNASRVFLDGAVLIGLQPEIIPDLAQLNQRLQSRTKWSAVPVSGFLPAQQFFSCLAERRFPTTVTIRDANHQDYVPEPDIFHDVFGHVPLHSDPVFAEFLQRFGKLSAAVKSEEDRERMTRLFWFTVEFGLIREGGQTKVYGSGLISSHGDCLNALGPKCERRPFTLDAVFAQQFEIDHLQDVLFVLESFDQLFAAVEEAKERLQS